MDGKYFVTPNEAIDRIPEIGYFAYCVYSVLCLHADRDRTCFPSERLIAEKCGATERGVRNAIKKLTDAGMVTIERRTRNGKTMSNLYRLHGGRNGGSALNGHSARNSGSQEGGTAVPPNNTKRTKPNKSGEPELPEELNNPEIRELWGCWEQHRTEIKKPLKPTARRLQLAKLVAIGPARAAAALKHSLESGYLGIYEPSRPASGNGKPATRPDTESKPLLFEVRNPDLQRKYMGGQP